MGIGRGWKGMPGGPERFETGHTLAIRVAQERAHKCVYMHMGAHAHVPSIMLAVALVPVSTQHEYKTDIVPYDTPYTGGPHTATQCT